MNIKPLGTTLPLYFLILKENSVPVPLYPPQIPHERPWGWTLTFFGEKHAHNQPPEVSSNWKITYINYYVQAPRLGCLITGEAPYLWISLCASICAPARCQAWFTVPTESLEAFNSFPDSLLRLLAYCDSASDLRQQRHRGEDSSRLSPQVTLFPLPLPLRFKS
jgi:hypothetical protein